MASTRLRTIASDERGQASVAFVAVVPGLILVALAALQFALAGHAAISAASSARAAARASYTGERIGEAARAALPESFRDAAEVHRREDGIEIEVEAPRALPFLPLIAVSASAGLGPEDGMPDG